jgi:hypothetical protein
MLQQDLHQMRFSYCWQGTEYGAIFYSDVDSSQWLQWNAVFCIEDNPAADIGGCYKMARRKLYAKEEILLLRPDTFVGGLFSCESGTNCSNKAAVPVAPLLVDEPYMVWHDTFPKYVEIVPFLYTPDRSSIYYPRIDTSWAKYIDIDEDYDESLDDDETEIARNDRLLRVVHVLEASMGMLSNKSHVRAKLYDLLSRVYRLAPGLSKQVLERAIEVFNQT